jgi:hypothetical protein
MSDFAQPGSRTCSCGVDFDYLSPRYCIAAGSREEAVATGRAYEKGGPKNPQVAYHPDDLGADVRARFAGVWAVRFWVPLGKGLNSPLLVREAERWTE